MASSVRSSATFGLPMDARRASNEHPAAALLPVVVKGPLKSAPRLQVVAVATNHREGAAMQPGEELLHSRGNDAMAEVAGRRRGVPVYVMMPLDTVSGEGKLQRPRAVGASLAALRSAGVEGVMVDVWWGLVERKEPGRYDWTAYVELVEMAARSGLKVQAVMSFHQCGGNVGDSTHSIPLPPWVLEEMSRNPDMAYTDRSGRRNPEYISLGCDTLPVLRGRTPIQVYSDYMRSFRDTFNQHLGHVIVEIQVGMGPCGELRYPSYPESHGTWRFPESFSTGCCHGGGARGMGPGRSAQRRALQPVPGGHRLLLQGGRLELRLWPLLPAVVLWEPPRARRPPPRCGRGHLPGHQREALRQGRRHPLALPHPLPRGRAHRRLLQHAPPRWIPPGGTGAGGAGRRAELHLHGDAGRAAARPCQLLAGDARAAGEAGGGGSRCGARRGECAREVRRGGIREGAAGGCWRRWRGAKRVHIPEDEQEDVRGRELAALRGLREEHVGDRDKCGTSDGGFWPF